MNNLMKNHSKIPRSPIINLINNELEKGIEISRDPVNAILGDLAIKTTNITSDWFADTCMVCAFTFREEDKVRLCPKCKRAIHQEPRYGLECWQNHYQQSDLCPCGEYEPSYKVKVNHEDLENVEDKNPESEYLDKGTIIPAIYDQFTNGLQKHWTPFRGEKVTIRVASRGDSVTGKKCQGCQFRIREGDRYIRCSDCELAYFHSDVLRHLNCWNNWHGQEGRNYCPISGKKCKNLA